MLEHKPYGYYWRTAFHNASTRSDFVDIGLQACRRIEELEERVVALGGDISGGSFLRSHAEALGRAGEIVSQEKQIAEVSGIHS